jgi:hypothetical protein
MNDQSAPGGLHGVLDRLLRFVDTPWKAFALAGLAALAFAGWIVWDKRTELFEAWLTPDTPALRTADVPEALTKLASETNADLIQIWAVDLASNSQWFLGARRHDGERPVIPSPRRLPIIDQTSDVLKLVEVLEGHPTCVDLSMTGTPVVRRLAERGMKRGCAVPIPPNPESFVGVIYLAWPGKTDDSNENVAVGAAREIAKKLATR